MAASDYTRCRALGHSWFDADSDWKPYQGARVVPLTLRCERCTMERRDTIDPIDGRLVGRSYFRPADYLYGKGELPTRSDFRLQLISLRLKEQRRDRKRHMAAVPSQGA